MDIYTEEHTIFRRTFRKFVEQELVPHVEEREEKGEIPREIWKKLWDQGYLCP